mgnify:CR=1 FL=1
MAKPTKETPEEKLEDILRGQAEDAFQALTPLRNSWDEKEQALLARANDSYSGNVVRARVTDAALSTLSFERQARVAAQLPTGKVYPTGKADESKAKLADIVLHRYIVPNANAQKPQLVKQRLWGVYASVYGSMPMFYDYRVDDDYIGPDCWLVDPRSFLPQPGRNSIQECDWVMISTIVTVKQLEQMAKKDAKKTSWNVEELKKLIKVAKDGNPTRNNDANKTSQTQSLRYSQDLVKGQVELITKYEAGDDGRWQTFAPDYKEVGILRDIPNPHKSGKIPVVMRDCFPLLNSIYGLGDFERGMKIQKAKDSLLGLRLEFVKNKVYPALKIDVNKVTPSTIQYGAGRKWRVTDMNGVEPVNYGNDSETGFQNTFSVLNGIQQDQFGTSQTNLSGDDAANPQFGKTPAAIKMQRAQENARDTWDRFMHEQAVAELYEGMINLLSVKMEKPINFSVFEEEIRQIAEDYPDTLTEMNGGRFGLMTVAKKEINTDKGYQYVIDPNSSMQKDDEAQLEALMQSYQLLAQDPNLQAVLQQQNIRWDQAEHVKKILVASGVSDWERILQEGQEQVPDQMGMEGEMPIDPTTGQPIDPMMQQPIDPYEGIPPIEVPGFDDPDVQAYAEHMLGSA